MMDALTKSVLDFVLRCALCCGSLLPKLNFLLRFMFCWHTGTAAKDIILEYHYRCG